MTLRGFFILFQTPLTQVTLELGSMTDRHHARYSPNGRHPSQSSYFHQSMQSVSFNPSRDPNRSAGSDQPPALPPRHQHMLAAGQPPLLPPRLLSSSSMTQLYTEVETLPPRKVSASLPRLSASSQEESVGSLTSAAAMIIKPEVFQTARC